MTVSNETRREYVLMNQDIPVLDFDCCRNEFGEPKFIEKQWHTGHRPIGYRSLSAFLARRKAPKHRKHIQQLLDQYGCDDLEGFLQVTHVLSFNDTFWMRKADSNLIWRQVSLYTNPFSEIISQAATKVAAFLAYFLFSPVNGSLNSFIVI